MLTKSLTLASDNITYDLEDSVTPTAKPTARSALANHLSSLSTRPSSVAELAVRIQEMDVAQVDRTELMRCDLAVHRAIYRVAGNPHLEDVLIRYDNLATRIFCLFLDRLPTVDEHVGEHEQLLQAIATGNAERADELAREHVLGFETAIRAVI